MNRLSAQQNREYGKMHLDTFTFDLQNNFDNPTDQLIQQLESDLTKIWKELEKYKKNISEQSRIKNEEDEKIFGFNLDSTENDLQIDIFYRNVEIITIAEMKIVYAYKFFEINVKRLLRMAYSDSRPKEYFKWENLTNFLAAKKIAIRDIESYTEINQLRIVNNTIKHTDNIIEDVEVKNIPEFKGIKAISYQGVIKFYDRIKLAPIEFLKSLANAIFGELYTFSNERLAEIAFEYASRMEGEDAKKFCEKLLSHY